MARGRRALTDEGLITLVDAIKENGGSLRAASRQLGLPRSTAQHHLGHAVQRGLIDANSLNQPNIAALTDIAGARDRKIEQFRAARQKGSWDKPVMINLPDRPFALVLFGDPHMDSHAFDIELWEKYWNVLDAVNGVYGMCVGDWFNNWLRVLGHLWKGEGDPDDAWMLFQHYVETRGDALLAACSGNHDDWTHAPTDPIDMLLKQNGVVYRKGAVRLALRAGQTVITVALRHKWKGYSMYSPAHGLRVAAEKGWHDHIMVGGHIHQDEDRVYVQPRTGHISRLFQLSAFKRFDDFADTHGFRPHSTLPARVLVVDPRRSESDPDRIVSFHDPYVALAYLDTVRRPRAARALANNASGVSSLRNLV